MNQNMANNQPTDDQMANLGGNVNITNNSTVPLNTHNQVDTSPAIQVSDVANDATVTSQLTDNPPSEGVTYGYGAVAAAVSGTTLEDDLANPMDLDFARIQEIGKKLSLETDQDRKYMGEELLKLDPIEFEPFESEKVLKGLIEYLQQRGMEDQQASELFNMIIGRATDMAHIRILASLNDKTRAAFEDLHSFGPNAFQQMFLLDTIATKIMGSSYDKEYEKALFEVINVIGNIIDTQFKSIPKIASLSDEQTQEVQSLFDSGKFEDAINLIYDYSKENVTR